jgi:hypothetical protein
VTWTRNGYHLGGRLDFRVLGRKWYVKLGEEEEMEEAIGGKTGM